MPFPSAIRLAGLAFPFLACLPAAAQDASVFASRFSMAPGIMALPARVPEQSAIAPEPAPTEGRTVTTAPLPLLDDARRDRVRTASFVVPASMAPSSGDRRPTMRLVSVSLDSYEDAGTVVRGGRVRAVAASPPAETLPAAAKAGRLGGRVSGSPGEAPPETPSADVLSSRFPPMPEVAERTDGADEGSLGGISLDRSIRLVRRGGAPDPSGGVGNFSLAVSSLSGTGHLVPPAH